MDQETLEALKNWWNEVSFEGKEIYRLEDNGDLVLTKGVSNTERVIANLAPDTADAVLKTLVEKYNEAAARIKELQVEWVATEDKLKLIGKVERTKDYLLHTAAVGPVQDLFREVTEWEKVLHQLTGENYNSKLKLAQQAEELADSENFKEGAKAFKDLTELWKQIGYVDKDRNDKLWDRIEAAKTKFFDRKRQFQEDHGKEMLQNLDLKMELVEKAEKLAASEEWKEATEVFRKLMDEWKTVGRTMHDKNEALWQRFIAAKNAFFDRKKEHSDNIHKEQENNAVLKQAIIDKALVLQDSTKWNATSDAYEELMEEWKKVGRVAGELGEELWQKFQAAKDVFFKAKRAHFETARVSMEDNLTRKMAILNRAESLKNSTQWSDTTAEMNELMDEWKSIGPVPRAQSEDIWQRFLAARKNFFERKDASREKRKEQFEKHKTERVAQTHNFVQTLQDEIKEHEEELADFKNGLENITPGKKAAELREHLENLIKEVGAKIEKKRAKLEDARKQSEELLQKTKAEKEKPKAKQTNEAPPAEATTETTEAPAEEQEAVTASAEEQAETVTASADEPAAEEQEGATPSEA